MGVVPISTNLGAHSDRIQHGINGLLVPPHDSQMVVQTLLKLHADRKLLASLRNGALAVKLMSIEEHGKNLEQIYSDLQPRNLPNSINDDLQLNAQLNLSALGVRLGQDLWNQISVKWDDPS